ncbi:18439_t:CDS:2, partial [Gigaspora rosea]
SVLRDSTVYTNSSALSAESLKPNATPIPKPPNSNDLSKSRMQDITITNPTRTTTAIEKEAI